jgi:hypothetical protein
MTIVQSIGRTVRRAVITGIAVTAGTALAAFARTTKGKELRAKAEEKIASGIASLRSRFFGAASEPVAEGPEAIEAAAHLEHEHALEHGPEGRKWAASHAHKPHAAPTPINSGQRISAMRRVARHI